jgi:hypothetical protein
MADKQWVVTCRWPGGDINMRVKARDEAHARKEADEYNRLKLCSLEHVVEQVKALDG